MTKKSTLSPKSRSMLKQLKAEARERILKRDLVQFRVDEAMMDLLLKVAAHKRKAVGVIVREWVERALAKQIKLLPLPEVKLSDGRVLNENSSPREIEKAMLEFHNGTKLLTSKDYKTLMYWLMERHLAEKYSIDH